VYILKAGCNTRSGNDSSVPKAVYIAPSSLKTEHRMFISETLENMAYAVKAFFPGNLS
jgi:hypothetical protein